MLGPGCPFPMKLTHSTFTTIGKKNKNWFLNTSITTPIFGSLLPSESLIFMAGCDIISLTAGQKIRGLSEWHAPKSNSLLLSGRPSYNNRKYFLFLLGYFILFYLPIYTDGRWKGGKTFLTVYQIQAFALFVLRMHSCTVSRSCKSHRESVPSTETALVLLPKHFWT